MATYAPVSRVSILWHDEKLLCHDEWTVATGVRMEQGRATAIRVFLAVDPNGFNLPAGQACFGIKGFAVQLVSILAQRTQPRRCSAVALLDVRHLGGKGGEQKIN